MRERKLVVRQDDRGDWCVYLVIESGPLSRHASREEALRAATRAPDEPDAPPRPSPGGYGVTTTYVYGPDARLEFPRGDKVTTYTYSGDRLVRVQHPPGQG